MKRRQFLRASAASVGMGLASARAHGSEEASTPVGKPALKGPNAMRAGFARATITPPIGTTMMGFGDRDMAHGCERIHDDIYVRALFLEHEGERALIMGFDLCFLGREDADRLKGAIGRRIDLLPHQILLNTSHNHVGPSVGTWYSAGYEPPDRLYLNDLERATVAAACQARDALREVTISAGVTRSAVPMNRRKKMPDGKFENRPNPDGKPYDRLPICLFKDTAGKPVCLLFSISCHPSMMHGWEISAEYPGAAIRQLDEHLGTPCSLFLQGCGGDAKPIVIGRGQEAWIPGTWELMEEAGGMIKGEVVEAINKGLDPIEPELRTGAVEMAWPLQPAPTRAELEAVIAQTAPENRTRPMPSPANPAPTPGFYMHYRWAAHQIELLDRYGSLPTSVTLTAHAMQLGKGLRIAGIEGEAVGEWGFIIEDFYGKGVTFPLGYTDGQGLYLPTTRMLPEGGYEVDSPWEYGLPSLLAPGMDDIVLKALTQLRDHSIA